MEVNGAFFVYQKENRENLLAQTVSASQRVVWATGTHTSTPVFVFVKGEEHPLPKFCIIPGWANWRLMSCSK